MNIESALKHKILAVDDDSSLYASLKLVLADDFNIEFAIGAKPALHALSNTTFDCVLLDMNMPEISGLELLKLLRARRPELPVIMLTASRDPQTIIEVMKSGASDYVIKETSNLETELRFRIRQVIEKKLLLGQNKKLVAKLTQDAKKYEIVGQSKAILQIQSYIRALKGSAVSVMIHGETGSGKELVARALNLQEKDGTERPFIAVNCSAIPENLAESELFGHEKGAFTGAAQRQIGKFVAADGGDIFLDEIAELSAALQSKLLRVIQERVVTPVGSTKPIPINVRIIAATHRDLLAEVKRGRFREDLYYRLNVMTITVPALRERKEDIPLLVEHFLKHFGTPKNAITKEALEKIMQYTWAGNIRALSNCLERAWYTAKMHEKLMIEKEHLIFSDTVSDEDLKIPSEYLVHSSNDLTSSHYQRFLDWAEKQYYEAAFKVIGENKTKLSEKLGQSRDYIHRRFKALGIGSGKSQEDEHA